MIISQWQTGVLSALWLRFSGSQVQIESMEHRTGNKKWIDQKVVRCSGLFSVHNTTCRDVRWWGVCCMCQLPEWSPLRHVNWQLTFSESFHHLEIETGAVKKLRHLLNQNSLPVRQKVSMIGSIRGLGHYSLPFQINILTRWRWLMQRHSHLIRDLSLKILSWLSMEIQIDLSQVDILLDISQKYDNN